MSKIAFLSFYSGVVERGVETFVYEIAKRLNAKHQITIFQAGRTIRLPKIRTYQISAMAKMPRSTKGILGKLCLDLQSLKILIFTAKSIPKLITSKYDVVIPLNGGWQTLVCRILSKLIGTKMLISGHAGIGLDDTINLFFRPDTFVALTNAQASWAKRIVPEVNIKVIPNGVDLASFNPKVRPAAIELTKPIVVCASALVPYKRIDLTIRAVSKSGMSLLLLGDGELKGFLDSLGKRLLGKRYLRLNPPYKNMPSYYRTGSIFTLASETEAFGISYLEAMASNLPIVTTNDHSRAEIIGNAGILTEPQNIDLYAKDLQIAAKTNYHNIPYDQALKFSWNKIAGSYLKLIRELTR